MLANLKINPIPSLPVSYCTGQQTSHYKTIANHFEVNIITSQMITVQFMVDGVGGI